MKAGKKAHAFGSAGLARRPPCRRAGRGRGNRSLHESQAGGGNRPGCAYRHIAPGRRRLLSSCQTEGARHDHDNCIGTELVAFGTTRRRMAQTQPRHMGTGNAERGDAARHRPHRAALEQSCSLTLPRSASLTGSPRVRTTVGVRAKRRKAAISRNCVGPRLTRRGYWRRGSPSPISASRRGRAWQKRWATAKAACRRNLRSAP